MTTKPAALSIGTFPDDTMAELNRRFEVHHFPRIDHVLEELRPDVAARIRAIGTEANQGISPALLAKLPKLEVVAVFGVGLDLVDRPGLKARGIPLSNTPGLVAVEVADLAMGMMLASARQIIFADRYVRDGKWKQAQISLGRSVHNKTLGIVGLGSIGRPIADRAKAFDMRVLYQGPHKKADAPYEYVPDVVELARQSDFLVIACKGGSETRNLISEEVMVALGPKGTLINVARGTVVDEDALVRVLRDHRLGFAALDVFENEPNVAAEILELPNVIVQPHHGSATLETRIGMGRLMIDNMSAGLRGQMLMSPVSG